MFVFKTFSSSKHKMHMFFNLYPLVKGYYGRPHKLYIINQHLQPSR